MSWMFTSASLLRSFVPTWSAVAGRVGRHIVEVQERSFFGDGKGIPAGYIFICRLVP